MFIARHRCGLNRVASFVAAGLLFAAGAAHAQSSAPKPPTGAAGQPLLGPPPVQFEPASLDLGVLKPSANAAGTVMIHNISGKWLTIKATRASCTCTAVNLAKTEIAPGQAIPLDVSYHAASTMGAKAASVRILFEGYDVIEVPITATVSLPVRSEPMHIDALKKKDGTQALSGQFTVFSMDQKPFHVLAVNGRAPDFVNFDATTDSPRDSYILKWDLTAYDATTCKNAAGERMPGWIVVETDHPDAPIFDLEIRNECNRRESATQMDTWSLADKRVLAGAVRAGEPTEIEVMLRWLPGRKHEGKPSAVVSESPNFTVQLGEVTEIEEGLMVKLKVTPSKGAKGLVLGSMRIHGQRQSAPLVFIATVR